MLDIRTIAYNPIEFPEGSTIRSVYTGEVYVITKHFKNGMCNLYNPRKRHNEAWNAYNNAHFVLSENLTLATYTLLWTL